MKYCFIFTLLFLIFLRQSTVAQCTLPKPSVVTVTKATSCDATITWTAVPDAAYYKVRYRFRNINGWTMVNTQITGTTYTFTNLVGDSAYKFGVASFCSNGSGSQYKNAQKTTPLVTVPDSLKTTEVAGTSVSFSWMEHCPVSSYNFRYHITATHPWTVLRNISTTSFVVNNLLTNTSYDFQVQAQSGIDTSKWTKSLRVNSGDTIVAPPQGQTVSSLKPNMVIFVLDDGRYDPYIPTGGPAWFNTPSINRIASEGINFVYSFPTTSQCAPSRVSIYSGLYASHHGAIDNITRQYDGIPLVQKILQDAGYYTGFVGKYGQFQGDPQGFDWWATSDGNIFTDPPYKINGKDTSITGHITDVYQNLAITFLNQVPAGQKFCLMFFTRIPHAPTLPRSEDMSLFTNETMPFPDNFYRYTENYPSYLYSSGHNWTLEENQTDSAKLADFQCLYGAEVNMTAIMNWLTTKGTLDSTIIIFTSDNGYLSGEHKLKAKQLALEESIRVPMFIRYPAWFTPGEVNTSLMTFNVDIAPTLLDAAGIPDTFGMDGSSLNQLYKGNISRKYFYYQFAGDGPTPALRAVRSNEYIYIKTYCTEITEEFYDLINDPKENTNQINNTTFSPTIANYRTVLDSIKNALGDNNPGLLDCNLSNPKLTREENEEDQAYNLKNLEVYPNPASEYFIVNFNDEVREDISITISNLLNEVVYFKKMPETNSFKLIVKAEWEAGLYMVSVKKGNQFYTRKFTLQ